MNIMNKEIIKVRNVANDTINRMDITKKDMDEMSDIPEDIYNKMILSFILSSYHEVALLYADQDVFYNMSDPERLAFFMWVTYSAPNSKLQEAMTTMTLQRLEIIHAKNEQSK